MILSARRWLALSGLVLCLSGTGCATAAEVGGRLAGALLGAALEGAASGGSSSTSAAGPVAESVEEGRETPCRRRRDDWHKANGGSMEDAPAHLRCKPDGDWPDEEAMRAGRTPGL